MMKRKLLISLVLIALVVFLIVSLAAGDSLYGKYLTVADVEILL